VPDHGNALSVKNSCTLKSSGEQNEIEGYVYYKEGELKSKLKLHFYKKGLIGGGPPWDGNYWVLEVGPLNMNGLYDWAIVSDPMSLLLFVLARDVDDFDKKYDKDIKKKVKDLGFKGFLKPIKTKQGDDCVY
jgi:lipocalin